MNNLDKQNRINISNENKQIIISKKLPLNIRYPYKINIYKKININNVGSKKTKIMFFKGTTNEAILNLYSPNINFAILNFANSKHVGGGYTHGSMAQEEELCRTIIDLFPSLALRTDRSFNYIKFYWYKHVLYSKKLTLYRYDNSQSNGKYNMLFTPIKVSVITAAAPDLNRDKSNINLFINNKNLIFDTIYKIIRTVCLYPIYLNKINKEDKINILILGAFGCGAFSPSIQLQNKLNIKYNEEIANLFVKVLKNTPNLLTIYDYIYFAIPNGDNYDTFYNIFKLNNLL
jgi:uncharacterized protein (TIGR02452 family)